MKYCEKYIRNGKDKVLSTKICYFSKLLQLSMKTKKKNQKTKYMKTVPTEWIEDSKDQIGLPNVIICEILSNSVLRNLN